MKNNLIWGGIAAFLVGGTSVKAVSYPQNAIAEIPKGVFSYLSQQSNKVNLQNSRLSFVEHDKEEQNKNSSKIVLHQRSQPAKLQDIKIPIFSFHNIIDTANPMEMRQYQNSSNTDYTNTKQDMTKFLEYLVRNNYWLLSSQELYDYFLTKSRPIPPEKLSQRPIMLTFDDGYKGVHTHLFPLIKTLKNKSGKSIKIVWFINPRSMGSLGSETSLPHVSCEELIEGFKQGFYDIQSHGFSHLELTKLNSQQLRFELAEAQQALRRCTQGLNSNQTVASHIAYPYGSFNAQVKAYSSQYYLSGYSFENQTLNANKFTSKYQLPRLNIKKQTSINQIIKMAESSSLLRNK